MSDHPIIATPHGVEAVEAVVQWASSGNILDGKPGVILDFLSENGVTFGYGGGPGSAMCFGTADGSDVDVCPGQWLVRHIDNTVTVHDTDPRIEPTWEHQPASDVYTGRFPRITRPTYPITLAGKPYKLVGEWVEVGE